MRVKFLLSVLVIPALVACGEDITQGDHKDTKSGSVADACVELKTTKGDIQLRLNRAEAPQSVSNFLSYAGSGFYEGLIFHRVISGFMIQGGGFDQLFNQKQTNAPIENEANNGLQNLRGTISMARTSDPHSATSQFFINLVDNSFLNYSAETTRGWGYAVFGKVIQGMSVVDSIGASATGANGPFAQDVPLEEIVINSVNEIACP
ncbi:MAG: peptidylprolyl isomerase [Gammaproteobacteria bacterium]|nr:peptidylprolyl isomerase [Gammaproteobacteria bacterium]